MMRRCATVLVGGGAAGTAALIAASKAGLLPGIARDLCVVERGAALGAGRLGRYAINSDSTAATFLSAVRDNPVAALAALIEHPAALAVAGFEADAAVPLPLVGRFLDAIGIVLQEEIREAGGTVMLGQTVARAQRAGSVWRLFDAAGTPLCEAGQLVLATGAFQPLDTLAQAIVAGEPLVARHADRLIQSDDLLVEGGHEMIRDRLAGREAVRIAIIGGSTSAVATANRLLSDHHALPFARGGLTILHRSRLLAFYHSADAARADGYDAFDANDICAISGFVHRFGGLRLDARALVRRQLGRAGTPDPRLSLHQISAGRDERALAILDEADLVIAALGYRPRALPLIEADNSEIPLAAAAGGPLVDGACRVLRADGTALPDVFAIGLAAGFRPSGELGGEPSFNGQVNGLWLWQNGVGARIVEQLTAAQRSREAA